MGRVSGKVALVTGAASGIGRGAALALAAEGAKLVVTDVDEAGLKETAALIGKAGGTASVHKHDVTSEARWAEIVAATKAEFGGLHILVNNAGIAIGASLQGAPGLAGYCATKGAVRLFTKAVALECAQGQMNVRVNSVHPGIIDTAIWQKMTPGGTDALASSVLPIAEGANAIDPNAIAAATPLGYAGVPADIAAGIVFLASDESRYMTGSELVIDGGMTAR